MLQGSCHCGAVRITLARVPEYGNACQCSLCRRLGAIIGYLEAAEIRIEGHPEATQSYDRPGGCLHYVRCRHCGCFTHWEPRDPADTPRRGINLRLFAAEDIAGVPVRESAGPGSEGDAPRYLGIDFSGGAAPWRADCRAPSVWVATVEYGETRRVVDLRPVQTLPGDGAPFDRLVALLRHGDHAAAAIDAPFAIPAAHLPPGGHAALLARVADLPAASDRPFPSGAELLALACEAQPLARPKPHRETEGVWAARGVNTRSTLWNGPRPGAPFTAACLTLLARAARPVWPWSSGPGMLVEAFPAAQLQAWQLPHHGYGRPEQHAARATIVTALAERVELGAAHRARMEECPDALDAVVAAFAGIAAADRGAPATYPADGLIAVHD